MGEMTICGNGSEPGVLKGTLSCYDFCKKGKVRDSWLRR